MVDKPEADECSENRQAEQSQTSGEELPVPAAAESVIARENQQEQVPQPGASTAPPPPGRERGHRASLTTVANVLSVVVAFLTLLVLYLTFCRTGELFRNEQRAWIGPADNIIGVPAIEERVVTSVALILTNYGKTPAKHVQQKSTYAVFPEGQHPEPQFTITDPVKPSSGILFPGERQILYATSDSPLTADEVRDIEQGTRALHLFIEITYEDFSGEARRTRLAHLLVRSPSVPSTRAWRVASYWNEAE